MASNVSKAGITTDATGASYIPSSVRADGSKRREIRVRPGYKPPEDVELYRNRAAAAWKNREKSGVPGAEPLSSGDDKSAATDATAASNKNAKRREAKRQAKQAEASESSNDKKGSGSDNWRVPAKKDEKPTEPEEPVDLEAEKEKKARNLKKKLRQARDLRDKKNQGEALLPEQLEKVIKIHELVRQLETLGFDSNGDAKENGQKKHENMSECSHQLNSAGAVESSSKFMIRMVTRGKDLCAPSHTSDSIPKLCTRYHLQLNLSLFAKVPFADRYTNVALKQL